MNARQVLIIAMAVLAIASVVRGGHELPVYPSYYPHEIEIATIAPEAAGALLGSDKLHAYVGTPPRFPAGQPASVEAVKSLGSFVMVTLNPAAPVGANEASACAAIGSVARGMTSGGELIAHAYPVTPFHGDYLYHADLVEAAASRLGASGSDVPAQRELKVRVGGTLAQKLVRPEWQAAGAEWEAALTTVDARDLVASASMTMNGWMGPRWSRSGWFHAYRLLAGSIADPERKQRVEASVERLQTGSIESAVERVNAERDLVRLLTAECRAVVVGYTVKREYFNAGFSAGIENLSYDALEGFSSPMFLRTVKLKDFPWNGWLQLGIEARPEAAWNPIGGFTGEFGRLMWFAGGDPAAVPSPYDHGWVLNRISEVEALPRQ